MNKQELISEIQRIIEKIPVKSQEVLSHYFLASSTIEIDHLLDNIEDYVQNNVNNKSIEEDWDLLRRAAKERRNKSVDYYDEDIKGIEQFLINRL